MKYLNLLCFAFFIHGLMSCDQKPPMDPVLQEALTIQNKAIKIGESVDSIIVARMDTDTSQNGAILREQWKGSVKFWRESMVAIPGVATKNSEVAMATDSTEDHSGHDHGAEGHETQSNLTPYHIKLAQEKWLETVVLIDSMLRKQYPN